MKQGKLSKKMALVILVLVVLTFMGCKDGSAVEQLPPSTGEQGNTVADTEGNIYIVNQSQNSLLFYYQNAGKPTLLKRIPANADNATSVSPFLVHVPTDGNESKVLEIWREDQVGNILEPSTEAYRKWTVVLSAQTDDESKRYVWVVKDGTSSGTGSVSFTYDSLMPNGLDNNYSVDVFLDSKTGSKIASIAPGTTDKQIGLEYDTYRLYFRYWFSDPNFYNGDVKEIGWKQNDTSVTLNASFDQEDVEVPAYWNSKVGKTANLHVNNLTKDTVTLYNGTQLIEESVISNQSTANISNLPGNRGYTLEVHENQYTLIARQYSDNAKLSERQVELIANYDFTWNVGEESTMVDVSVTNNTDKKISVHNQLDGTYLGYVIDSGSTETIPVNSTITDLRFMDLSSTNVGATKDCTSGAVQVDELAVADFQGPGVVTSLTATADVGSITLDWTIPADEDYKGVMILRSETVAPKSVNDLSATVVYDGSASSFVDTGLTSGKKYYYSVYSYDKLRNLSLESKIVEETPAHPSDVSSFNIIPGDTTSQLTWENPTGSWFKEVVIVRSGARIPQNLNDGTIVYKGTGTSYSDISLTNGNRYYYSIFTKDLGSNLSSGKNQYVIPNDDLQAPGNIYGITSMHNRDSITLQWTNPSDSDLQKIIIVRAEDAIPSDRDDGDVIYNGNVITEFIDTLEIDPNISYFYKFYTQDEYENTNNGTDYTVYPFKTEETKSGFISTRGGAISLDFEIPEGVSSMTMTLKMCGDQSSYYEYSDIYMNSQYIGQASTGSDHQDLRVPSGWDKKEISSSYWTPGTTATIYIDNSYDVDTFYQSNFEVTLFYSY